MNEESFDPPFLRLARALENQAAARTVPPREMDDIMPLFEAAVEGVQSRMPHLSEADIAFPPHAWFDAALARQIAIHIMNNRFFVAKKELARELARSREAINRAVRTVDERLAQPEFADSYEAMSAAAKEAWTRRWQDR